MAKILYLSYDGMSDPLGQSQVLPYLTGLASRGHRITLVSFEKESAFAKSGSRLGSMLEESNIEWVKLRFHHNPPLLSKVYDLWKLHHTVKKLAVGETFDIVHCRSYMTSLIGLQLKRKSGVKFIFDMRGFWIDERVEGKIWNLNNPLYKLIYRIFRKKEKQFLMEADQVISLTENARATMEEWHLKENLPVEIIPCCCDMDLFNSHNLDAGKVEETRSRLALRNDEFALCYLGALGTWYLLDEMIRFFKILLEHNPNSRFVFITPHPPPEILASAAKFKVASEKITIVQLERNLIPAALSLCHASVFFYKPTFSRKACSPTKQAEIMSMGIPVVCNAGIGDTDEIITKSEAGIVINNFSDQEFQKAAELITRKNQFHSENIRKHASQYFSLIHGVNCYHKIYTSLANP